MKFRNQFLKYQLHMNEGDAGGEGGGGGGGSEGNENNGGDNSQSFDNMWDTDTSQQGNQQQQNQQQSQSQQAAPSAEEVFNSHVQGLGFGAEANDLMAAMESRDPEAVGKAVAGMQASTYRAAMVDVNKLVNQRVDAAMEANTQNTHNTIEANSVIAQMESALPWTRQPAYAPMAKAVVNQMLQKEGMTPEKAIAETAKYFQQFANDANTGQQAPNGKPTGNFQNQNGNNSQNNNAEDDTVDWIDFLGGKPK